MVSFFFSTLGLETAGQDELCDLLVREGQIRFLDEQRRVAARKLNDASGNEMWSVSLVVGDEDKTYVVDGPRADQPSGGGQF
jgi:hypothetical protein